MSIIKFTNRKNTGTHSIRDGIKYIVNPEKTSISLINGNGVSLDTTAQDMETVAFLLDKNWGRRYIHLILSFDEGVLPEQAYSVTNACTEYFAKSYQYVFAIHTNTENIHAHVLINAVNIRTGHKFSQSRSEMLQFRDYVNTILVSHGLNPVGKIGNTDTNVNCSFDFDNFFDENEYQNMDNYDDQADLNCSIQSFFGPVDSEELEQLQEADLYDSECREILRFFQGEREMLPSGLSLDEAESYFAAWLDQQRYLDNEEEHKHGFFQ